MDNIVKQRTKNDCLSSDVRGTKGWVVLVSLLVARQPNLHRWHAGCGVVAVGK